MQNKIDWANEGYYRHEARELSPIRKAAWTVIDDLAQANLLLVRAAQAPKITATLECWNSRHVRAHCRHASGAH